MKSSKLIWGLIPGVFFITWKLFIYFSHNQFTRLGIFSSPIGLLVLLICVYFSIRLSRNKELGSYLTLRQAMKAGMQTVLISALMVSLFTFVYYKFIDLEFVEYYILETQKKLVKEGKTIEEINKTISTIRNEVLTPFRQATAILAYTLIAGAFFTFISSTFLVKNPPVQAN